MIHINSLKWGEITINKKTYYSDMIIFWDGTIKYRTKNHKFTIQELALLLPKKPEALVVGIGMSCAVSIDEEVKQVCEDKGIKLYKDKSPNAVDIFNGLVADGKKAVAVIHTTC